MSIVESQHLAQVADRGLPRSTDTMHTVCASDSCVPGPPAVTRGALIKPFVAALFRDVIG